VLGLDDRVYRNVTAYFYTVFPSTEVLSMEFVKHTKAILTDSHFLVPLFVLIAGIVLLVVLH
jgi:hypothetical protein